MRGCSFEAGPEGPAVGREAKTRRGYGERDENEAMTPSVFDSCRSEIGPGLRAWWDPREPSFGQAMDFTVTLSEC